VNKGTVALTLILLGLFGLTLWWVIAAWGIASDVQISTHGYIAMALGIVFSLIVGCGLMALIFYSNRHGYDEPPVLRSPSNHQDNASLPNPHNGPE